MMKPCIFSSVLFLMWTGTNCAWALNVQPGEWISKRDGKSVNFCVQPEMAAQLKKWQPGDQFGLNACSTHYLENAADKMVFETICKGGLMGTWHRLNRRVEILKVSDTAFSLTALSVESDRSGQKDKLTHTAALSFVGQVCSVASKTHSVDFING
ncbi:hypothetical protein BVD23_02795 [Salmonella enterica]|nr:hypothetical protein [Salmonella enterica]ECJ5916501.1 hypothetical protein [Salmonella enterica subsp. salamae]HCM1829090.1 hypothetical protein [Salmonella enterica subsp. salamae serovar 48:z81:z39]HCM1881407.1 hypothetical protein [Salmonella enterica subsp. salamae serovar 60:z10:z39]EAN4944343.1 hypothetical protein [Salmonella enterica]